MDMLRSCYRAEMRTIIDGAPVPVVWYRTPVGAAVYSGPTVFRSRNYHNPHDNAGIGEQYDPDRCCFGEGDRWVNGAKPNAASVGPRPCGTDAVAQAGAGPTDPTFETNDDGSAPCCTPVPDCPPIAFPNAGYALVEWFPGVHAFGVLNPAVPIWRLFVGGGNFIDIFCAPGFIRLELHTPFELPVFPDVYTEGYALFTIPPFFPYPPVWWGLTVELFWPDPPP